MKKVKIITCQKKKIFNQQDKKKELQVSKILIVDIKNQMITIHKVKRIYKKQQMIQESKQK